MRPSWSIVNNFKDRIKAKLTELRKIKNKGEYVSDLINQANELIDQADGLIPSLRGKGK